MTSSGIHFDYDKVPYPELSFPQTHPSNLAMLGSLLGMNPAPPTKCRVLEIGCAAGSNLLPMAVTAPESTFVGIDLSGNQIQKAAETAAAVNLTNITFKHMDILDIEPDFGEFDYIIAHGILSWVPPHVRDKLFDICKRNLAPQGIAYISYNAYPGWHRMEIIRNMMLFRTRDVETPEEKSAQARQWISFVADALADSKDSAYAAIFSNYLDFRKTQTSAIDHSALLHDELEANNQPYYFYQFIEQAEAHGLQYLVEAYFPKVMPNGLSDEAMQHLTSIAKTTVEMEQYFDFLRDTVFRSTLLCHAEVEVDRRLSIAPLQNFYVSSFANELDNPEAEAEGKVSFVISSGKKFDTDHALTIAVFRCLVEAEPERIYFPELIKRAAARLGLQEISQDDWVTAAANILRAFSFSEEMIKLHTFAPPLTTQVSERPKATTLARYQARWGITVINLLHTRLQLDKFRRLILSRLDGETDQAALLEMLVKLVESGELKAKSQPDASPEDLREQLRAEIEKTLHRFGEMGLLVS
ncbi:MAG: class I SAM-dependent methyltransferase [Chloroflexi bacterium]|nr:class I SAM-dependent methyltransferase [Chloroflexota bacterium]MCC6894806.1 class I SAM-dependent methyltransferase [Anaerolineae bacterium]